MRGIAAIAAALAVLAACGLGGGSSGGSAASSWVDQPVSFPASGMTVYGTYRHPTGKMAAIPAALIIAGSGPTDRNGNSPAIGGQVGTLEALAGWLSAASVASLRYDKLGTGQTGLGPYASDPSSIGIGVFEQEAAAALGFLARQPGVDRARLSVYGHSEGALYALLLATGAAGQAPPVHALGLLEPLGVRYLDLLSHQIDARLATQQRAGQLTAAQVAQVRATLSDAIKTLRMAGTVPAGLPDGLSTVLSPATARYLAEADRYDPANLAARLRQGMPVLVSCSDADIQVSCADVDHLAVGLARAAADTDQARLTGVDHVLKEDSSATAAYYGKPLPFSSQLEGAVLDFARR